MNPETQRTFKVAILLCLVCSVVVSSLAVGLKDIQNQKKEAFRQQSILSAAGKWTEGADAAELFAELITPVVVDLEINKATDRYTADDSKLDVAFAQRTPEFNDPLDAAADVAGIMKREKYSIVYEVREEEGAPVTVLVLPIRGRGLWSTLYGFVALDLVHAADGATGLKVKGLTYYKHGETPGLGGEVDNLLWKAKWPGKSIYDKEWNVKVEVAKNAKTEYQVDALSGATLTSNGVTNMLKFWLGENGFGPYLQNTLATTSPPVSSTDDPPQLSAVSGSRN
ncbi:MAG: Na(+)-translocating NADH-quinone reductase subunit C [Fuerstiella sp.]|nr:Na(+)-translocating NADH-quinone reductase subunit C [Fuerstiella sp.]